MSTSIAAPASRNAACPCGSGRRYKDCHGALAARGGHAGIGKQRNGPIGTVRLTFLGEYTRFESFAPGG